MDQAQMPTYLALAMNAVVVLLMIASFFRRYATKDDIKDLNDKLGSVESRLGGMENRLGNVEAGQAALETKLVSVENRLGNVEAGQVALEFRQGALENQLANLDSSIRENGSKVDASLDLHNAVRSDLKVLQASVSRLDSYFETPKLKSS